MCQPNDTAPVTAHGAAAARAAPPPSRRGGLKKRGAACLQIPHNEEPEEDALSSAATPPPCAAANARAEDAPWVTHKRPCPPGGRRVLISRASDVRYIAGLTRLADERRGGAAADQAGDGPPDGVEATKFGDGPAPEAVVVERLVGAVTSGASCEKTAVCPILKALVRTGARDLLRRVHERLTCMGDRVSERGRLSVLPSSALLGREAAPLLCFLRESVGRSAALVDQFAQPAGLPAADSTDLTADERCTAAAMALILG
jgi:hypothetical protein